MADDDAVGYRRPPKGSQFGQPGGNRRGPGRRKGARNMATIFAATAGAIIEPKVEGRTRKMSKLEAAMTQLANKAASGDLTITRRPVEELRALIEDKRDR